MIEMKIKIIVENIKIIFIINSVNFLIISIGMVNGSLLEYYFT